MHASIINTSSVTLSLGRRIFLVRMRLAGIRTGVSMAGVTNSISTEPRAQYFSTYVHANRG